MTEKEKMISQKLYDARSDRELEAERLECKSLCQEYNHLPIKELEKRSELIKRILGKTGDCVTIGDDVVIGGGSIVVKDIPSGSVAVGNPCKVIRKITDKDRQRNWDRPGNQGSQETLIP